MMNPSKTIISRITVCCRPSPASLGLPTCHTPESSPKPQGLIRVEIEEQKRPPLADGFVRQPAKNVGMLALGSPTAASNGSSPQKFHWNGKFVANPQVLGGWIPPYLLFTRNSAIKTRPLTRK